jgi:hypothetical protein
VKNLTLKLASFGFVSENQEIGAFTKRTVAEMGCSHGNLKLN